MRPYPAARNTSQTRHRTCKKCQSSSALPLDQRLESFANQCRFLSDASELTGNAEEIIIKVEGYSHRH
jgi:methylphosphotriester-DNA--protein-cysteine methyltransferase